MDSWHCNSAHNLCAVTKNPWKDHTQPPPPAFCESLIFSFDVSDAVAESGARTFPKWISFAFLVWFLTLDKQTQETFYLFSFSSFLFFASWYSCISVVGGCFAGVLVCPSEVPDCSRCLFTHVFALSDPRQTQGVRKPSGCFHFISVLL